MIPPFLVERFGKVGAKLTLVGGVLVLIGLAVLLSYCVGRGDGKAGEVVKQQDREIEILNDLIEASDNAEDARAADTDRIMLEEKELTDALKNTSDPDVRRALRGCVVMRQQGRDTRSIPTCTRPAGSRGAAVP